MFYGDFNSLVDLYFFRIQYNCHLSGGLWLQNNTIPYSVNHQQYPSIFRPSVLRYVLSQIVVIRFNISFTLLYLDRPSVLRMLSSQIASQSTSQPEMNPKLEQIVTTNVLLMNLYLWTLIFIKNTTKILVLNCLSSSSSMNVCGGFGATLDFHHLLLLLFDLFDIKQLLFRYSVGSRYG